METIFLVIDKSNQFENNWTFDCFKTAEGALKFMKGTYSAPIRNKNNEEVDAEYFEKFFDKVGKGCRFYQMIHGYDDDNECISIISEYEVRLVELK